tara:strand:+ start:4156 stop:4452 length:297 start_codon:yes stop_codon:yes gene_type:complete
MELKFLETNVALKNLRLKLESSIEDFKEKTPHRKDIIESMENSLENVELINTMYEWLKTYYKTNDIVQYLHIEEIEKLKVENQKLEDQLEKIKSNLEL